MDSGPFSWEGRTSEIFVEYKMVIVLGVQEFALFVDTAAMENTAIDLFLTLATSDRVDKHGQTDPVSFPYSPDFDIEGVPRQRVMHNAQGRETHVLRDRRTDWEWTHGFLTDSSTGIGCDDSVHANTVPSF